MEPVTNPTQLKVPSHRHEKALLFKLFKNLVEREFSDPTQLFEAGLRLLVTQLKVQNAVMIRTIDQEFEAIWWAIHDDGPPGPEVLEPHRAFCSRVLDGTSRTLVIRDALADPDCRAQPAGADLQVRAFIGVPLRRSDTSIGVLCAQSSRARAFTRNHVILVNLVGNLLSKAMEIELLKQELHNTREALDLTVSAMQDGALETNTTRLPSRGFLEVWLRAYLFLARRRSESMAVAVWTVPVTREVCRHLRKIAEQARGEDLLVDLGREQFALLLPRTDPAGAEVVLDRVRRLLGPIPMGATIWHPMNPADQDDLTIRNALQRAHEALHRRRAQGPAERTEWVLPESASRSLAQDLGLDVPEPGALKHPRRQHR